MASFLASLAHDDLASATVRGYRYDLRHFLAWHRTVQDRPFRGRPNIRDVSRKVVEAAVPG